MKVKYVGPDESVQIAATGQVVESGGVVDVDDALGKSLIQQDIWEQVKTSAKDKKSSSQSSG